MRPRTNGKIISSSSYLIYTVTLETLEIHFERLEFENLRDEARFYRAEFR